MQMRAAKSKSHMRTIILILLVFIMITVSFISGCKGNNSEIKTQDTDSVETPVLNYLMKETSFSSADLGVAYDLPEKYFRQDKYYIKDTNWCVLSIKEGVYDPEDDRDKSADLNELLYDDYQVVDKGTVKVDGHEGFWVESKYTNDDEPVIEHSVYLPHPSAPADQKWDFMITITGVDSEENKSDFENYVSKIPEMIEYSDKTDNNASAISGIYINNENLIMQETAMNLHDYYIMNMDEEFLSGRPVSVATSVESIIISNPDSDPVEGDAEAVFNYYSSLAKVTNSHVETGTTTIDGRECYWFKYNSEADDESSKQTAGDTNTFGHYLLFFNGKDNKPIVFSLVFKGDVNSKWSKGGISDITKTITFLDD